MAMAAIGSAADKDDQVRQHYTVLFYTLSSSEDVRCLCGLWACKGHWLARRHCGVCLMGRAGAMLLAGSFQLVFCKYYHESLLHPKLYIMMCSSWTFASTTGSCAAWASPVQLSQARSSSTRTTCLRRPRLVWLRSYEAILFLYDKTPVCTKRDCSRHGEAAGTDRKINEQ